MNPRSNKTPLFPLLSLSRLRTATDGFGITTLVAGAGCPLRCKYCVNRRILAEKEPEWVTPETLFARTRIDNLYFQATGGGLCFGGGEALLHVDFIKAFRSFTGVAWRLTAETSLHVPPAAVTEAAGVFDAFIVDVKTLDPAVYKAYTGVEIGPVYENLKTLISLVPPAGVKVRVPLIPGFNTAADCEKTVSTLKNMGYEAIERFEYIKN